MDQYNVGGTATTLQTGRFGVRIPVETTNISLLLNVQTYSGYRGPIPGVGWPGREDLTSI